MESVDEGKVLAEQVGLQFVNDFVTHTAKGVALIIGGISGALETQAHMSQDIASRAVSIVEKTGRAKTLSTKYQIQRLIWTFLSATA